MMVRVPDTMRAVETRYCCMSVGRLTPLVPDIRSGGVMTPASMANAC